MELNNNHSAPSFSTNISCSINFFKSESNLTMIITLLENIIAITVLFTVKTKRSNTHFLIKLMAINDLFSALGILTSSVAVTLSCEHFVNSLICKLIGWLSMSAFCSSLHIVVVMNIERYFMVCHPVTHRNHFTKKLLLFLSAVGLAVVYGVLGLPLVGVGKYDFYSNNGVCGFDLAPGSHPTQRILVGYCGCQGIIWVIITIMCTLKMSQKLKQRVQAMDNNDTQPKKPRRKVLCFTCGVKKQQMPSRFTFVTKVIAFVNCTMNLPMYVSIP